MVAGDVVNTAARLQSAAPVGSVIVGEETYVATRNVIEYRPAQPVLAKGKSAPVPAWLAVRATSQIGERPTTPVPMVGRERELGVLTGIWERVIEEGRAQLATVFGPAGIGKSRLGTRAGHARRRPGGACSSRSRDAVRRERALQRLRPAREADGDDLRQRRARRSAGKARCSDRTARRPSGCRGARTAARSAPRHRQRGNGRGSRDALLFRASLRRVAGDARPDDAPVRGHPLGRLEPARPPRDARVTRARRAGPVRGARAAGAPWRAADLGWRSPGVYGAPARSAQRRVEPGARRAVPCRTSRCARCLEGGRDGRGKSALHRGARRVDRGTLDLGRLADERPGDHRRPSRLPSSRRARPSSWTRRSRGASSGEEHSRRWRRTRTSREASTLSRTAA